MELDDKLQETSLPSILEPVLLGITDIITVYKYDVLQIRMPFMWEVQVYYLQQCLPTVSPTIELTIGSLVEVTESVELVNPEFIPSGPVRFYQSKNKKKSKGTWNNLRHVRVRSTPRSLYPFKPLLFNPFYLAWLDDEYIQTRCQILRVKQLSEELFGKPESE